MSRAFRFVVPGTIALMVAERKSGETGRRGNWLHVALSEAFYQSAPTMEPMKFSFVPDISNRSLSSNSRILHCGFLRKLIFLAIWLKKSSLDGKLFLLENMTKGALFWIFYILYFSYYILCNSRVSHKCIQIRNLFISVIVISQYYNCIKTAIKRFIFVGWK